MVKRFLIVGLIIGLLSSVGCATVGPNFRWEDASKVQIGMTKEEVVEVMGKPNGIHETGSYEVRTWTFMTADCFGRSRSKVFGVKFKEGKVTLINSHGKT